MSINQLFMLISIVSVSVYVFVILINSYASYTFYLIKSYQNIFKKIVKKFNKTTMMSLALFLSRTSARIGFNINIINSVLGSNITKSLETNYIQFSSYIYFLWFFEIGCFIPNY